MPEITIPQSKNNDVYDVGFDRSLNRDTYFSEKSSIVYDTVNQTVDSGSVNSLVQTITSKRIQPRVFTATG